MSVSPIELSAPGRAVPLQVRVSAPITGRDLPIVLFSHGHGSSNHLSSLNGYGPLASYWAARGFVVIQPTHLSSATLRGVVDANGPEGALFWRSRAEDMTRLLDALNAIEDAVPGLRGRMDRSRVAVAGHSLGAMTAGMLLGQRVTDFDGSVVDLRDPRIAAGVIIAGPGNPSFLTGAARDRYPILRTLDFSGMTAPALVVVGDQDVNPMFSDQAEYRAGAYTLSPGPKDLLTMHRPLPGFVELRCALCRPDRHSGHLPGPRPGPSEVLATARASRLSLRLVSRRPQSRRCSSVGAPSLHSLRQASLHIACGRCDRQAEIAGAGAAESTARRTTSMSGTCLSLCTR
ncbi:MAG: hypothetical protein EOO27_03000 [Comamonadaceae bacterium]|nr:MAG: hypothetical protein EOO27_03000 [Comamonadaceae bacterium]